MSQACDLLCRVSFTILLTTSSFELLGQEAEPEESLIDDSATETPEASLQDGEQPSAEVNLVDEAASQNSSSMDAADASSEPPLAAGSAALEADLQPTPPNQPGISKRRRPGSTFGLGVGAVQEIGAFNHYEKFYGAPQRFGSFYAGYYLYSYFVDFGVMGKLGYYGDRGHPLKSLPAGETVPLNKNLPDSIEVDKNQNLELTLIPAQVLLDLAISPLASRRIVLRGWVGYEQLYVQEVLKPNLPSGASSAEVSTYKSSGWNTGTVVGGMVSISLTGLEPRSDYALRAIGIDRTYISPYAEIVTTRDDRMGNYDRRIYGIAFSFESLR
jgi:hypothetical protein